MTTQQTQPETLQPEPYMHDYLEATLPGGITKHKYDPPLNSLDAPIPDIIDDFIDSIATTPTNVILLYDVEADETITIYCQSTDFIAIVLSRLILLENSPLHFLHSHPNMLALGVGLSSDCDLAYGAVYKIKGLNIVPI